MDVLDGTLNKVPQNYKHKLLNNNRIITNTENCVSFCTPENETDFELIHFLLTRILNFVRKKSTCETFMIVFILMMGIIKRYSKLS